MSKRLIIEFIEAAEAAYNTCGDYAETDDTLWFRITRFDNLIYSQAVLIHELWERVLCQRAGITDEEITTFDLAHPALDEPGADPAAPYHAQHMEATVIERMFISLAGEDWDAYDKAVMEKSAEWEAVHGRYQPKPSSA